MTMMLGAASKEDRQLNRIYLARPEHFMDQELGWQPWEKQVEILHSLRDYKETFVKSCNAAGKTWLAAGIVLWWVLTRRGKVITTAPTWRQVREVLWAKVGAQCAKVPQLGIKPLQTRVEIEPDWYAVGLSTRTPDKFQGYHGNVLIVVDEAAGVTDPEIWAAIDGNLTDFKHDRLLAIGNPTDPSSVFAAKCKMPMTRGKVRNVITISAYDTPNVMAGHEVVPGLITKQFVDQKRQEWGENSPLYQARILGEFPRTGTQSLFPLSWLDRAFAYDTTGENPLPDISDGVGVLGFDVGGGGMDNNAMCYRTGGKIQAIVGWPEIDTSELVLGEETNQPAFYKWVDKFGPTVAYIDATPPGKPIYDYARKHKRTSERYSRLRIRPFIAQKTARDEKMYMNMKAEAYWQFRKLLETTNLDMSLIQGEMRDRIETQANAIRWDLDAKGRVRIESKEKMRAREGFSPDELEAAIMAFYGANNPKVDPNATANFNYGGDEDEDFSASRSLDLVRSFDYDYGAYTR